MLVYKAQNQIDGKIYIGATSKTEKARWKEHLWFAQRGCPYHFHRAIRKHGPGAFKIEILHHAKSIVELSAMETFFIVLHQSHKPENGYNQTLGGEGFVGIGRSAEHSFKISQALQGIKRSKEFGDQVAERNRSRLVSSETRKKMRDAKVGAHWKWSPEARKRRSDSMKGRTIRFRNTDNKLATD